MSDKTKKPKKARYTTGKHVCKYPKLVKPDTKFKALGEYSVQLVMTPTEAAELFERIKPDVEAQVAEAKDKDKKIAKWQPAYPVTDEVDPDTEEETGNKLVKFKQAARVEPEGKDPIDFHIALVDAKGKKIDNPKGLKLGSNSVLRVCFTVRAVPSPISKNFSVQLNPVGVQIVQLVEWQSNETFDEFTPEEGGFEVGEESEEAPSGGEEGGEAGDF